MNRKQRRKQQRVTAQETNQQQINSVGPAPAPPRTPEEALRLLRIVAVPIETFLGWIAALANVPSQFGAALYVALQQQLNETVDSVAATCERKYSSAR